MPSEFTTARRVEFADTDMAGIVHFTNFYRWMEQAEHEFFRSLGLEIIYPQEDGSIISWPRASASCSFKAPAYYKDVLDIELTVIRKGASSLTMKFEFSRDGTQIAVGELKTVCCRIRPDEPMEPIEMPPPYCDFLEEAEES